MSVKVACVAAWMSACRRVVCRAVTRPWIRAATVAALVLIPAQLPLGFFMKLLDRIAPAS